jgi:hypothetical protein
LLAATEARAGGGGLLAAQFLAVVGLAGGSVAGTVAGIRWPQPVGFGAAFLVYLGLLCVVASTWSGSLDIVPLTLALGAGTGILRFAASFFAVRHVVKRLRGRDGGASDNAPE